MLIPKDFVAYLSRRVVQRLIPAYMDSANPHGLAEVVQGIILAELEVEDKLNDEVRELLDHYTDYMRKEGVSYQEMFRRIKNTMISQRKIIKASGRETGDGMKLSRDKITDLSHKIAAALKKQRDARVKREANEVRLEIVKGFTEALLAEDKVDKEARLKITSQKKMIQEGTEEYDILHKRYYAEELKKLGIEMDS
jgi:uncharacterized protein